VTVTATPGLPASWIDVYTTDAAANRSGTTRYSFPLASADTLTSSWRIRDAASIDASGATPQWHSSSTSGVDHPLSLKEDATVTSSTSSGVTITDQNSGPIVDQDATGLYELHADGVNDYAQAVGPVVTTSSSFAIAARVRPDAVNRGRDQTFVSQWGAHDSAFYLQYAADGSMRFGLTSADSTTRTLTFATATGSDVLDVAKCGRALQNSDPTAPDFWTPDGWHTITGVYDSTDQQIQLWVDDCPNAIAQVAAPTSAWNATGAFTVGTALNAGSDATNTFGGGITRVLAFQGVPTQDEIQTYLEADNV
jgi:hypothetical protein